MDQKQLFHAMSAFIAVASSGSFSSAAKQLGYSQPSISRLVNELEADLGVRLLQRSTRKLSLTEAGTIYLQKAQKIQQDVLEAKQALNGFKQIPSGKLRVGAPLHWVDLFISPFINEFLARYPDIEIELMATDQHQDIVEDNLDVVLRVGDPKQVTYIAVPIKPVKLVLCASQEYLKQHAVISHINQLTQHNLLTYQGFNHWQAKINNEITHIQASGNLSCNQVTVLINAAVQGLGVILLPNLLVESYLNNNQLSTILSEYRFTIKNATVENMYAIYSDRMHLAAKTRVFLDFFKYKIQSV